ADAQSLRPGGSAPGRSADRRGDNHGAGAHARAATGKDRMKVAAVGVEAAPLERLRIADYLELTKPRIAVLVLVTVGVGALLAGGRGVDKLLLLHAVAGTALVAAGASALNQLLERQRD